MFAFIRRHWVAYLIAAIVALALGFGAAFFVGVKGSLPADVRAERIAAEKKAAESNSQIQEYSEGSEEDDDALDDGAATSDSDSDSDASSEDTSDSQVAEGEFQDVETSED